MENPKIKNLIEHYFHVFEGTPWYGDAIMDKLPNIASAIALRKPAPDRSSIAEIVWHMIAWREYVIKKMEGQGDFNIEMNTPADWTKKSLDWIQLLEKLKANQKELIQKLSSHSDDWLDQIVPGKTHNFDVLLQGIIRHDVYHLGQIGLIQQSLEKK